MKCFVCGDKRLTKRSMYENSLSWSVLGKQRIVLLCDACLNAFDANMINLARETLQSKIFNAWGKEIFTGGFPSLKNKEKVIGKWRVKKKASV